MNRKISFAFVLMLIATLASISSIIGIVPAIISLSKAFHWIPLLHVICDSVVALIPLAIVVLLYFNSEQYDVDTFSCIVLFIGAVANLGKVALNFSEIIIQIPLLGTSSSYLVMGPFAANITFALMGFLFIFAAVSIIRYDRVIIVPILVPLCIVPCLLLLGLSFSTIGGLSTAQSLSTLFLAYGLGCLPKTIYDYDECFFFNNNAFKLLATLSVVVGFFLLVGYAVANQDYSSSSSNVDSNSGSYRCNNCGGDGWDSENNRKCVWCGGDGKTSWNP